MPGLYQLKVLHSALLRLLVLACDGIAQVLLDLFPGLCDTLDLLLLREEIRHGAFATEYVPVAARYRITGYLEAEVAGAEGEERVAVQSGRVGGPGGLGEVAFVGCEDASGRVALAMRHGAVEYCQR